MLPIKTRAVLIGAVWVVGVAASLPLAIRLSYIDDALICVATSYPPVHQIVYAACYITVGWIVPGVILVTLYYKTAGQLKMSEDYHSHARVMQRQIRRENREVVKMFVVVVALFFACTMPNAVYQIVYHYIYLFRVEANSPYLIQIYTILPCLSAMNSCINPLVYAKMHKEMNRHMRGLATMLRRTLCSQSVQRLDTCSRSQGGNTDTMVGGNGGLLKSVIEETSFSNNAK